MSRRSHTAWIVGSFHEKSLAEASRLPTNQHVISRYLFFRRDDTNTSARDIFKVILTELECVWNKSAIPMKDRKHQLDQLIHLYNQWNSLKKISLSRRQKPSKLIETKINSFEKVLASLCDLSATDAYHQLRSSHRKHWKEDWNFHENQKTSRTFYISNKDQAFSQSEDRRIARVLHQEKIVEISRSPLTDTTITLKSSDSETSDSSSKEDEFQLPSPKKRKKPVTVDLQFSATKLISTSVQVADRCGISISNQLLLTSQIVNSGGGNISDFSLSKSSIWRKRSSVRAELAKTIKLEWLKENPKHLIVHWDTKIFQTSSNKKQERIAVIISGSNSG